MNINDLCNFCYKKYGNIDKHCKYKYCEYCSNLQFKTFEINFDILKINNNINNVFIKSKHFEKKLDDLSNFDFKTSKKTLNLIDNYCNKNKIDKKIKYEKIVK